jgi:hypothetical protein
VPSATRPSLPVSGGPEGKFQLPNCRPLRRQTDDEVAFEAGKPDDEAAFEAGTDDEDGLRVDQNMLGEDVTW